MYLASAGIDALIALKAMFVLYAFLGVAGCLLYMRIPPRPLPLNSGHALSDLRGRSCISWQPSSGLDAFAGGFVVQELWLNLGDAA